jgi:P4 family phage/plasmid primase-like protien
LYEKDPGDHNGLPAPLITLDQPDEPDVTDRVTSNPKPPTPPPLLLGSDVEIAQLIASRLKRHFGSTPYCEGQFWQYTNTHWEPIPRDELRRRVHECDGMEWGYERRHVRLGKSRIDSIINELGVILTKPGFFETHKVGINCLSGFISFEGGTPTLVPHDPEHRQRHVIPAQWGEQGGLAEISAGTLLARLLGGSFNGDEDAGGKIDLLGEIAGAAALGHGPRLTAPKAVVLLGRTAENGKSQILDLLRGLLPPGAVSSVPPTKFGDDRHSVKLVGKLLNTSDELGTAKAIASEGFKAIITGEPVMAREVYAPAIEFRPQAQHVFACNQLPGFHGGMDRGVIRRLMPIVFNRTIPERERVPNIGQRVVAEELDLVLAWAVEGAARLLGRGHFPELASSREALQEWAQGADPVLGWIEDRVSTSGLIAVGEDPPRMTTRDAYDDFKIWAAQEGYAPGGLPSVNTFSQRVRAAAPGRGFAYRRSGGFRGFLGVRLKPSRTANLARRVDAA